MTVAAFFALAALILAILGLASSPRWPLAQPLAVIFLAVAVCIIGFSGHIPLPH